MADTSERLVNFRCYVDADPLPLDLTDIDLPALEMMTETISGSAIAGEYASPVTGHFGSQVLKLKWRAVTAAGLKLLAPGTHILDVRGSLQTRNPIAGTLTTQALRIECTGQSKTKGLGKLEPGKVMGTEADVECSVIRISIDGAPYIEIDKFNQIFKVNGVDYLQKVRQDVGGV